MKAIIFIVLALVAYASAHLCKAEGDPHYRTFGGKYFNFYATGEYVLFKRQNFQCNSRLAQSDRHWRGRSLNAGVACKINGVYFEVSQRGEHLHVYLQRNKNFNGRLRPNGVDVSRQGSNFSVKYKDMQLKGTYYKLNGGKLRYYMNLYVYSHHSGASGLCQGQKTRASRTFFHHGNAPGFHVGHETAIPNKWIKWAAAQCGKHFKKGSFSYNSCVTDMAATKKKRVAGQYEQFSHVIKGDFRRVCHKTHCHYYKRVTKVRHVKVAKHHNRWVTVADHNKRNAAKRNAAIIRQRMANLNKVRSQQISNSHATAKRQIANYNKQIQNAHKHYTNTVRNWNNWRVSQHKSYNAHYQNTIKQINKWAHGIRVHADKHYKNTVAHWSKWRANTINHANKHASQVVNKMNVWRKNTINQANAHRSKVIKSITLWRNKRIAYLQNEIKKAHAHYRNTVNNINKWHVQRVKYANNHRNNQINAIQKWRKARHAYAQKTYAQKIKAVQNWRKSRHLYANNHRNNVINAKRRWVTQKRTWANNHRNQQVNKITVWRQNAIRNYQNHIKRVNSWKNGQLRNIANNYNRQMAALAKQLKHWNTVARTATKRVLKRHTTYHTKKVVTHHWVHIHHHK